MNEQKTVARKKETSTRSTSNLLKIVGGAAFVIGAALVIVSLPDIKRYIKISTM